MKFDPERSEIGRIAVEVADLETVGERCEEDEEQ